MIQIIVSLLHMHMDVATCSAHVSMRVARACVRLGTIIQKFISPKKQQKTFRTTIPKKENTQKFLCSSRFARLAFSCIVFCFLPGKVFTWLTIYSLIFVDLLFVHHMTWIFFVVLAFEKHGTQYDSCKFNKCDYQRVALRNFVKTLLRAHKKNIFHCSGDHVIYS